MRDYYGIKDVGELIIKGKDYELNIDIVNEIHTIKTDKTSIVILNIELINDELEEKLCNIKKGEFNLKLECKSYLTGEHLTTERLFKNMSFVKKEARYNSERVTGFLFVFADKNYRKIKDILNDYFDRNIITDCSSCLNSKVDRISESINSIGYTLKDLHNECQTYKFNTSLEHKHECCNEILKKVNEEIDKVLQCKNKLKL